MANTIYPKWKQFLLAGLLSGDIKAVLVDTADYTYSAAHEFLSDIPAGAREETSANFASKTGTNGVFDAADISFTGATGDPCEALVLYIDTGTASTSRLVAYIDSATGLPITLNGGDANITWDASGILAL